ncbi:MAG: UDP-N-acetylglucosamine 2-epimerase (non-hydrolyzing) [Firmicutes bacterium]|nr:UDP-N-acetylglucosamine 2-epimerase (non-hydrolyzing) [Bacillota bacterium]
MKVMTLFGTRPEIIRLSQVIKQLDRFCEQLLVHTGQNYDPNLSDIFFDELGLRPPDIHLGVQATGFAEQAGQILSRVGEVLSQAKPDRLLILGDTDSGLAAIVAARMRIPVYHMEAGNRCYDDRVPEEINRRIIDHCSHVLMPYTHRSKENLLREGIERQRIFVIGNPIYEVLEAYREQIDSSNVLSRLNVAPKEYFLATLHRAENVDDPTRLEQLLRGLALVADTYQEPMVVSLHPRTADKLARSGLSPQSERVRLLKPLGFFDFVKLERHAHCVLSDSGTVQEECCIFKVPNVTLRDVTERPETIECGSNILTGADPERILQSVTTVLESVCSWMPPAEYLEACVSRTVAKIVLGYL